MQRSLVFQDLFCGGESVIGLDTKRIELRGPKQDSLAKLIFLFHDKELSDRRQNPKLGRSVNRTIEEEIQFNILKTPDSMLLATADNQQKGRGGL